LWAGWRNPADLRMTDYRTFVTHVSCSESTIVPFHNGFTKQTCLPFDSSLHSASPRHWTDSEVVRLFAWLATPILVGGNIVVDREDIDVTVQNIPAHHGYFEDVEVFSSHHRSINPLDTPVEVVLEVLLNLLLGLRAVAQAFKRSIQLNEPFRDAISAVLAIGATLGSELTNSTWLPMRFGDER